MPSKQQSEPKKISSDVLKGKTILVTRSPEQAVEFSKRLHEYGANVVVVPTVQFVEPESWSECDEAVRGIKGFDSVIFTSANAVEFFFKRVDKVRQQAAEFQSLSLYAVGSRTQEAVVHFGLKAEVLTEQYSGKALAEALKQSMKKNSKVLFPHGNLGNHELPQLLRETGIDVTEVVVYRNVEPTTHDQSLLKQHFDVITFFSPSSIKNFLKIVPKKDTTDCVIAVIGETTEKAAHASGLPVHIVPKVSTANDLADAIASFFEHLTKEKTFHAS
ncbi:MAG: uroporphyrinogen-III synthase [Bacteroidota bacterium]|nr:uroporphyrinogen-III synthase [Bacteroidota bacterium]